MAKEKDTSQAQESLDKFEAWAASLSDVDFVAIGRGAKWPVILMVKSFALILTAQKITSIFVSMTRSFLYKTIGIEGCKTAL